MYEFKISKDLKNKKIKTFFKENVEPEEIILDNLTENQEEKFGFSDKKIETPLAKKILFGFYTFVLLLFFSFFLRTFQLQVIQKENFLAQARANKFIIHSLEASRGVIYDRNWEQLVFNKPSFDLICNKLDLPESEQEKRKILTEVSLILKINSEELEKQIKESENDLVPVARNLDHQNLIILKANIDGFTGFQILENRIREYKDGPVFSHLLGYTAKITREELKKEPEVYSILDYIGRDGLERSYEMILRKKSGELRLKRDALGNIISQETVSLPEPGKGLVLWLDSDLQRKIKEELEKTIKEIGSQKGAVVALNPKTGGVLALVSLPGFDNNLFNPDSPSEVIKNILKDPSHPLFNRATAGTYPTGSVIKPLIALAALEEKIISSRKKIDCQGKIQIRHRYQPEIIYQYKDWKIHGPTDMKKAIAESCNVYFYTIGGGYGTQDGLGPTKIKEYLESFGWGKTAQIDLPQQGKGFLPDPSWKKTVKKQSWFDGDTYNLSIGQGDISVTPLQVTSAISVLLNDGKLMKPQIVQKIVDSERNMIKEFPSQIIKELDFNPQNFQVVKEGMREAVTYGSAVILNALPEKVAAKTGTAQTNRKGYYHNWVTVFGPYEDPEIVLTVIIEDVKGVRAAALPIAKNVLEWYFTREPNF